MWEAYSGLITTSPVINGIILVDPSRQAPLSSGQDRTAMAYHAFDRAASHAHDQPNAHGFRRPSIDLPRPLEPRPTLQTSHSDTTGIPRRPDAFRSPAVSDNRSQYQSLPGLKDILNDRPSGAGSTSSPSWNRSSHPTQYVQGNDGQFPTHGLHPPMALYPPHTQSTGFQAQHARAFEIPILDTTRAGKHPAQQLPLSPYSTYPDSARDYSDPRMEGSAQAPTAPYMNNGIHSPYASLGIEDLQYTHASTGFDRPAGSPYAPSSTDSQQQYLGTKDVPGEGTFHVYEGGFRIPTHVDGEQVNPAWGLTKANKPRKRLALACLDCREKKIKCEPGGTSCLQCEKAKRPCRRYDLYSNRMTDADALAGLQVNLLKSTAQSVLGRTPHRPLSARLLLPQTQLLQRTET
jgi:hypothetical protein